MFTLQSEVRLPASPGEIWPFFADPRNLELLTPRLLCFEMINRAPIDMAVGTRIDYKLHIRGIPIRWQSEITAWQPPHRFVDEQRRGPYRCWIHEHTFVPDGDGTIARDFVRYDHIGGRVVNNLWVKHDLRRIFRYRDKKLRKIFAPSGRS